MLKKIIVTLSLFMFSFYSSFAQAKETSEYIHDIHVKDISGKSINLSQYKGKVLVIINVASECGYTPQYDGLEKLYKKYNKKGLEILAFPSNDFGNQEPGTNEEIKQFCKKNYGVTFKLFDKVAVYGKNKIPLYERLTNNSSTGKSEIGWNFEKFIISKTGKVIKRFPSQIEPEDKNIVLNIEQELKK
jgi:glutathione peroxidase